MELEVNGEKLKTNALLNYDAGNLDWYPEPHMQETFTNAVTGEEITIKRRKHSLHQLVERSR